MAARGAGPGGRILRLVVGTDRLPELRFLAPDAPGWGHDGLVELIHDGTRFELRDDGAPVLAGAAEVSPFGLTIDVGDAEILGFGAATGRPDRNDQRFRIMTRDTLFYGIPGASYTALPFFIARRGPHVFGVLVATTLPLDVEISDGRVSITAACDTDGDPLDVIVFRGSMPDIARDLAALVGRTFLPPAWALGFHQSRWSYRTQQTVLDIARRFRDLALPADVIHLDIHYMDRYRVFTFSPERFPQPRRMHDDLHALGFRTLAIVDPGVAVAPMPAYEQLRSRDMLLERADGSEYHGQVWPGATAFPDFSQPAVRMAWGRLHEPLIEAGVAGFWNDMNDPVFQVGKVYDPLAEDVHHHGVPHRRVRNLYANDMAEATVTGLERLRPHTRPFVLSRSGFLGIQRHAAVWTGDNHSSWEHLRENLHMALNLGLSGVPLTGADVGGFGRGPGKYGAVKPLRPSAELFVRWMELGALMPFFRVHCTLYAWSQEPWSFGTRALKLTRAVLRRRYRLLPLLYRLALDAHTEGLPIVRPLHMHFDVPDGAGKDQFLLGEHVLAAPVLERGATRRTAWLPEGSWADWNSGAFLDGGRDHVVDAPLGTTPLFVQAGAPLFLAEPAHNAMETLRMPLALEVSPPPPGIVRRGSLFLDDGESTHGARYVNEASVERLTGQLAVRFSRLSNTFEPAQSHFELRVPPDFSYALVDGERRDLTFRNLAYEDRRAVMMALRAPLDVQQIILR
ncbi:MAG: glycoside hydrolase family 31 protein [Steroidobacteraceae bacterium]